MRLFRNKGHEPLVEFVELPDPHLDVANVGSGGRHRSNSANPDLSRLAEDDFAAAAANYLNHEVLAGRFEQVMIVADPRTLGELRKHFHQSLRAKLVGQLDRDLTEHSVESIKAIIAAA